MAIINGTPGDDRGEKSLNGTNAVDEIYGRGGNDALVGRDGNDVLEGGTGADELFGSAGFDIASYESSSAGVTVLLQAFFADRGDAAGDTLFGIEGLRGSAFVDGLGGDDQRNVLHGEGGNDELRGFGGNDTLHAGGGNDYLGGDEGNDDLRGDAGNDFLEGGPGNDTLHGGTGSDTARFQSTGLLNDSVVVDLASGTARGGDLVGSDRLFGIENVVGSDLADTIGGSNGANVLTGGGGADAINGEGGADRFLYRSKFDSLTASPDTINDFSRAEGDRIDLRTIDANEQAGGNQAFKFIGTAQFTGAGQLRYLHADGGTVIHANLTDATPGPEFGIVLGSLVTLQGGDFVL